MTFLPNIKFLRTVPLWFRKLLLPIFCMTIFCIPFCTQHSFANESGFLSNCIIAGSQEGGDDSTKTGENGKAYSSLTFNDIERYDYCKNKCNSAFSLVPKGDDSSSDKGNNQMNQGGIDACLSSCLTNQNNFVANNLAYDQQPMKDSTGKETQTKVYVTGYNSVVSSVPGYNKGASPCVSPRGSTCTDDPSISVLLTGIKRNEKENEANFSIELDTSKNTSDKNTIYRCGKKTVTLTPTYPNVFAMNPDVTDGGNAAVIITDPNQNEKNYFSYVLQPNFIKERLSNTRSSSPPYVWCPNGDEKKCGSESDFKSNPKMMHPCFANIPATTWGSLNTKDFLISCNGDGKCGLEQFWQNLMNTNSSSATQSSSLSGNSRNMQPDCYPNWHLYNSKYVDTGINIANGDELTIEWGGNIIADANKLMNPNSDLPSGSYSSIEAAVDVMWPDVQKYGVAKSTMVIDITRARDAIANARIGSVNINAPFSSKDILDILRYGTENGGPGIQDVNNYCSSKISNEEYKRFYNENDQYRKMAKWGTVNSWIAKIGWVPLSTHCPDPSKQLASDAAIGYIANRISEFDKSGSGNRQAASDPSKPPIFVDYKTAKLAILYGLSGSPSSDADNKSTAMDTFINNNRGNRIDYAKVLREISTIQVANLNPLIGEENDHFSSSGDGNSICRNAKSKETILARWYGLDGTISDVKDLLDESKVDKSKADEPNQQPLSCRAIQSPSLPRYAYEGTLSGLSTRTQLQIRHNINAGRHGIDLLGGHQVLIDWKGAPIKNGDGLQIAVVRTDLTAIPDSAWVSIADSLGGGGKKYTYNIKTNILPTQDGEDYTAYARIDPKKLKEAGCIEPIPPTVGTYDLRITSVGVKHGIVRSIIDKVQEVLFGKNMCSAQSRIADGGVVRVVYEAVIQPTKMYAMVLMLLFLVFSGFAFMTGIAKMNQQEFVHRSLKIAFVVAILGIGSWELFGKNMVQMFVCGALDLATIASPVMTFGSSGKMSIQSSGDALRIFDSLSGPLDILWSSYTLKRIWALMTTGIIGFVMAIGIVVAVVQMMMVIVPLAFAYIYSIIGVAVLIIMIPVISPLILFSMTKRYFDSAVKYLIVYGLFPMVIFATYSLLNMLIVTLVNIITFFSICPVCILEIFGGCVIPGYQIILPIFMPPQAEMSTFAAPIGGLAAVLGLLALTNFAKQLIQLGTKILNRVIGVQAFGSQSASDPADLVNLGEMTGGLPMKIASPYMQKAMSGAGSGIKGLFGKGVDAEEKSYQKEVDAKINNALRDTGYNPGANERGGANPEPNPGAANNPGVNPELNPGNARNND